MQEPNYKAAADTLTIVQTLYAGGLYQFREDGGELSYLPLVNCPDEFYIYSPKPLPQKLVDHLNKFGENVGIKYYYVQTRNFPPDTYSPESVIETLNEAITGFKGFVVINIFASIMLVTCDGVDKTSQEATDLIARFTKVPGVIRAIFIFKDGDFRYEAPAVEAAKLQATVTPEASRMDHPIGDSDMADLKILLHEAKTIDEIIAGM